MTDFTTVNPAAYHKSATTIAKILIEQFKRRLLLIEVEIAEWQMAEPGVFPYHMDQIADAIAALQRELIQVGEDIDFHSSIAGSTDLIQLNEIYEREERRQQILAVANAAKPG